MENRNSKEIVFSPEEFDQVTKHLMGSQIRPYPNILVPQSAGPARIHAREELMMQNVMESCPFRGVMSFFVGGAMGKNLYCHIRFKITGLVKMNDGGPLCVTRTNQNFL